MSSSLWTALAVWRPAAVLPDPKDLLKTPSTRKDPDDRPAIYIRTALVFSLTIGLLLRNISRPSLLNLLSHISSTQAAGFILCSPILVWHKIERWRVDSMLQTEAIRQFQEKLSPSEDVMEYLATHPAAVKQLISQKYAGLLTKICASTGRTLFQTLIHLDASRPALEEFKVFELLARLPGPLKDLANVADLFATRPDWAVYALEKDLIVPAMWTNAEQLVLWSKTDNAEVMRTLVAKRFDIDIENINRLTPLKQELTHILLKNLEDFITTPVRLSWKFFLLLSLGAKLPASSEILSVAYTQSGKADTYTTTTEGFLSDYYHLKPVFAQAEDSKPTDINLEEKAWMGTLTKPLVHVSFRKNRFEIAREVIQFQSGALFTTCFVASLFFPLSAPSILIPLALTVGVVCITLAYIHWSHRSAAARLNELAIRAFKEQRFPWSTTTRHIIQDPALVEQLVKELPDIHKLDDRGETLWSTFFSQTSYGAPTANQLAVFRLLIDKFFADTSKRAHYFLEVFRKGNPAFIRHMLTKKVTPSELTEEEQFNCWGSILDAETALLLKNYNGFNVDTKNADGYTALMVHALYDHRAQVQALLAAGPSLDHKVEIKNSTTGKMESNTIFGAKLSDPMRALLQNYQNSKR
jgi:hypothetical protein